MSALIKKHWYWLQGVDGDGIMTHFVGKDVGSVDALPLVLNGIPFHIYCMKELDYVLSIMSMYGTLKWVGKVHQCNVEDGGQKQQKPSTYPKVDFNHYQYCDPINANLRD